MTSAGRKFLAAVITVLASASILMAVLAHYASVVSAPSFAGRAVSVVRAGPVRSLIVDSISGRLLAEVGNQPSIQPLIQQAVQEALANRRVAADVQAAAESLQGQLLSGNAKTLTLTLPDAGSAIAASIQSQSPVLAAEVARVGTITVVDVRIPPSAAQAVNDLAALGRDSLLLVVLTVALCALALLLSVNRRRTLVGLGAGALVSGLIATAAYFGGRELILSEFSSQAAQTAARVVWRVYVGGLETLGLVIAGGGAALIAAAALIGSSRSPRHATPDWQRL